MWDLSDQDNDSMLSLREFCFALYLMERYREGRPLPAVLPNNVMFDETLLSMTGQSNIAHPNATWGPRPGTLPKLSIVLIFFCPLISLICLHFSLTLPSLKLGFGQPQPQVTARSMAPTAGLRPPTNVPASKADGAKLSNEQKSRSPVLEDSFLDQSQKGQQNSGSLNAQDATASEKKAFPYIYLSTFTIFFGEDLVSSYCECGIFFVSLYKFYIFLSIYFLFLFSS